MLNTVANEQMQYDVSHTDLYGHWDTDVWGIHVRISVHFFHEYDIMFYLWNKYIYCMYVCVCRSSRENMRSHSWKLYENTYIIPTNLCSIGDIIYIHNTMHNIYNIQNIIDIINNKNI